MTWFSDEVLDTLKRCPGSPEREEIIYALENACRYKLSASACKAAVETVSNAPETIEKCLGEFEPEDPFTWIEFEHDERYVPLNLKGTLRGLARMKKKPVICGCLVIAELADPSHFVVFVAWKMASGKIFHSYALLHWNLKRFRLLAQNCSKADPGHALARIAELGETAIPTGLMEEFEIWQGLSRSNPSKWQEAITQTHKEAMGEHAFLIASLLLMQSDAVIRKRGREPDKKRSAIANINTPATGESSDDETSLPSETEEGGLTIVMRDDLAKRRQRHPGFSLSFWSKSVKWRPFTG